MQASRRKAMAEHLTKESFKSKVFDWEKDKEWKYSGDLPAIVDFYAQWCGPCKMVGPILEEIATKYEGKLHVYKVDTDAEPELSGMFDIQSVPTLLFIPAEGQPSIALGALPKKDIERAIVDVLKVE
jgi:thioredoxin